MVEEVIDGLLVDIAILIPESDRSQYQKALAELRASHVASEKISLVKDLLPSILCPSGINPLQTLYDALSYGIHEETEEECMLTALAVREASLFLVSQSTAYKDSATSFADSMRKILDRRSRRGGA
jgi:hypothetical protein